MIWKINNGPIVENSQRICIKTIERIFYGKHATDILWENATDLFTVPFASPRHITERACSMFESAGFRERGFKFSCLKMAVSGLT
jgi:hypothetical protein